MTWPAPTTIPEDLLPLPHPCRKCGLPINAFFRLTLGSPENGWQHVPGQCPAPLLPEGHYFHSSEPAPGPCHLCQTPLWRWEHGAPDPETGERPVATACPKCDTSKDYAS